MDNEYKSLVNELFMLCGKNYRATARACGMTQTHIHSVINGKGPKEAKRSSVTKIQETIDRLKSKKTEPEVVRESGPTWGTQIPIDLLERIQRIDRILAAQPELVPELEEHLKSKGIIIKNH